MSRPRLPRCPEHQVARPDIPSRCPACCALRGTTPSPKQKSGTTGHQRGHPERRALKAALALHQRSGVGQRPTHPSQHPLDDDRAYARWAALGVERTARVRDEVRLWLRGPGWPGLIAVGTEIAPRVHERLPADPPVGHQLAMALVRLARQSASRNILDEDCLDALVGLLLRYHLAGSDRPTVDVPADLEGVRKRLQQLAAECLWRVALVRRLWGW